VCVSYVFTVALSGEVGGGSLYLHVFTTINLNLYQEKHKVEHFRNITVLIVTQAKAQHDFSSKIQIQKTQSSFDGVLFFPVCPKSLCILL